MITTMIHDTTDRLSSFERVARQPAASPGTPSG